MKLINMMTRYETGTTSARQLEQYKSWWRNIDVENVKPSTMKAFQKSLAHLAPSSQARICGTWRTFYRWACEEMDIAPRILPITQAKGVAVKGKALDAAQVQHLLAHLTDEDAHLLARFQLATGCRYCEARLVMPGDLGEDAVTLRHQKGNGLWNERRIPLDPTFAAELQAKAVHPLRPVLRYRDARWAKASDLYNEHLAEARRAAHINKPVTAHTLRHTVGTRLNALGVGLVGIAEILGHSSLETARIYVDQTPEDLRDDLVSAFDRGR